MKKYLLILFIALCFPFFSACGQEKNPNDNHQGGQIPTEENRNTEVGNSQQNQQNQQDDRDEAIKYYETETINLLCTGENGTVYTYNRKGKKFCEYNVTGECTKEYPVEAREVDAFSYYDGKFYYINAPHLYVMDLETGVSEELYTFDGKRFRFGRMVALEDSVFVIRMEQYNDVWADVSFDDEDGYVYEGEELLCFHPSTGEMEKADIPNIKQVNRKNNQELLVYAYDGEGGFYFTVYHTDGKMEEKRYTGIKFGTVRDIAYDDEFGRVVCADFSGVFLAPPDDLSGKAYAYENTGFGYNTLACADGFTYGVFTVGRKDCLVRMEDRKLVRDTPTLKGYTLTYYVPPRYGYPINCEMATEEEIAMTLLAGDSDYDFLILDSSHQIAADIRRTGAYYPLNSLGGLDALLNDCHAYVREGATAKNGDLWMLPFNVECALLFYNEDLIGEYGITLSDFSTYTKLINATLKLPDDGSVLHSIPYLLMMLDIENQYLGNYAVRENHADFHREEFKIYLDTRRKYDQRVAENSELFNNWNDYQYVGFQTQKEFFDHMLFSMIRSTAADGGVGFRYDQYEFIRALPAPRIQEGEEFKNQAQALFLVVNPNSERLQWVLEYLDEVCGGIREDEYSLMLKTNDFEGKPLWQDMQAVLADAEIYFEYPYEIVSNEVARYIREERSYEDTVNEMERKMNMYLNE